MSQVSFTFAGSPLSGTDMLTALTNMLTALRTGQSGTSRPSDATTPCFWLDTTTATAWALKLYDGTHDIVWAYFNSESGVFTPAAGMFPTAAAGGTADALTATFVPAINLADKTIVSVVAGAANTTSPTFAPNGLAAKSIVKGALQPLIAGDIKGAGHVLLLQYNAAADKWSLLNPANGLNARLRLTASATLYVATTGSDITGDGSSGAPFASVQAAWDYAMRYLDLAGYGLTIQLADGTYTAGLNADGRIPGQAGPVTIQGNATSPANVHLNVSGNGIQASNGASLSVLNLKITASSVAMYVAYGAPRVSFANLVFGAASSHIVVLEGGECYCGGNYSIVGGAAGAHWSVGPGGILRVESRTITITGTPAFSYFAYAHNGAMIYCPANTFSGSATGTRYYGVLNGVINTSGAGASYLPGSIAGSTATGGQYA